MPTKPKSLTDAAIARLKPGLKPFKVKDPNTTGLHLLVSKAGSKTFRYRYQRKGDEYIITLGRYRPNVPGHHMSLKKARAEAARLAAEIESGEHPARERDEHKQADRITFEHVARDYMESALPGMKRSTKYTTKRAFNYCKPLHKLEMEAIKPTEFRAVIVDLAKAEKIETAKKTRSFLNKVCRHAVGLGWRERNPIPDLPPIVQAKVKGLPAITDPVELGKLLRAIDDYEGNHTFRTYLRLLPHVFTRPGELRLAKWGEVDFERNRWTIPANRMKMNREHVVPLSKQAGQIFMDQTVWSDPDDDSFIFPSTTHADRAMSENTANFVLRQIGYNTKTQHTAHGFRKTASTLLNENGFDRELIERCLAHGDPDKIRAIYNLSELMDQRAALMQWWSDYLDNLISGVSPK